MNDIASMLMALLQGSGDQSAARLAALRGQPMPPPAPLPGMPQPSEADQRDQSFGLLGQLTGDRVLSPFGKSLAAAPLERQNLRAGSMKQAMEEAAYRKQQGDEATVSDPNSLRSKFASALGRKYTKNIPGFSLPPDATADQVEPLLGGAERGYAVDEMKAARLAATAAKTGAAKGKAESGLPDLGPEYEVTRPIDKKEIAEFNKKKAGTDDFRARLDDYENLLKQSEGSRLTGDLAGRIQASHGDLIPSWLHAKGLTRMTDNEQKLFDKMLPNMAGMGGVLKRDETAHGAASQLRSSADKDMGFTEKRLGLHRKGGGGGVDDVHAQAIAWAKANPGDPRSATILKLNGAP